MNLSQLGVGGIAFLALNISAIVVGVALLLTIGPNIPLILLIVGAAGLARKKVAVLLRPEASSILKHPD